MCVQVLIENKIVNSSLVNSVCMHRHYDIAIAMYHRSRFQIESALSSYNSTLMARTPLEP